MYTGHSGTAFERWPPTGWVRGSVADLSVLAQSASLPPNVVEEAAEQLVAGVSEAAGLMEGMAASNAGAVHKISELLLQEDGEQTRRMAATILANAFVFHGSLAGGPGELAEVRSLDELRSSGITKAAVLAEWKKVLAVNYWAIFDIARRILEVIPVALSGPLVERLADTADSLLQSRLMRSHDLTGQVFQKLISDRKFLAAYYTTPASAALLVGIALSPDRTPSNGLWSDRPGVVGLRIADFACGTGTLLSAAYQRVGQLYEMAGGDSAASHPDMMANVLVGCDVLPAAAHLTASMLSGAHPTIRYEDSTILNVHYGRQPEGDLRLGSLDLLDDQGRVENVAITARSFRGTGQSKQGLWWELSHASFDFVVMNPPFTRDTGQEGVRLGVRNPMFAAFAASEDDQREMSKQLRRLTKDTSARGNAGEGSIFLVLAHRKLKADGLLALVLPLSLLSGDAWASSRALLARHYTDIVVVSIAGAGNDDSSFSADTGMAECLIIARKSMPKHDRATFVVLRERPTSTLMGTVAAQQIRRMVGAGSLNRIENGPVGGSPIYFGDTLIGQAVDAPVGQADAWTVARPWNIARVADISLGQSAYQLADAGLLWLPGTQRADAVPVPICRLANTRAKIGPYHADINGANSSGQVRGPFNMVPITRGSVPTYPAIWSHDTENQRGMEFPPDKEAVPKVGRTAAEADVIAAKVAKVWEHASHAHFNRDFRFNSQTTAMQFTRRRALGGSAWIAVRLYSEELEKTLVLWSNTTLGLLLYWWHANKQQSGRGRIGVAPLDSLPVLNISVITPVQVAAAVKIFDETCTLDLRPLNEIAEDANRHLIDRRFGVEVLGLSKSAFAVNGQFDILR